MNILNAIKVTCGVVAVAGSVAVVYQSWKTLQEARAKTKVMEAENEELERMLAEKLAAAREVHEERMRYYQNLMKSNKAAHKVRMAALEIWTADWKAASEAGDYAKMIDLANAVV